MKKAFIEDEESEPPVVEVKEKIHVETPKEVWTERYVQAGGFKPKARFLTAFNANVDSIVFVKHEQLEKIISGLAQEELAKVEKKSSDGVREIRDRLDFISALLHCMAEGKGENVKATATVFEWFEKVFQPEEKRMGGQAGIVANQLAELGLKTTVFVSLLSKSQAHYFNSKVLYPVVKGKSLACISVKKAFRAGDLTKTNWIFEFHKHQSVKLGQRTITAPRSNRLIVTMPVHYDPRFPKELEKFLPKLAQANEVAFLSGYHAILQSPGKEKPEIVLKKAGEQIKLLKRNKKLLVHYEYVEPGDEKQRKLLLKNIGENADSMGLNEVETLDILHALGCDKEAKEIEKHERSYALYLGCKKILERLKLQRLHLHNFGYHLLLLKKPFENPEKARDALVFSALAACVKASDGKRYVNIPELKKAAFPVSETGVNQLNAFEAGVDEARPKRHSSFDRKRLLREGIFDLEDLIVIIIPTPILQNPQSTVGLGDTVSSMALAAEKS